MSNFDQSKLSMIISMAMRKSQEAEDNEKKKQKLLEIIKKAINEASFKKDDLLYKTDELYLLATSEIKSGKKIEGVRLLTYAYFGYYIVGDLQKLDEIKKNVSKIIEDIEKELVEWNEYDKAYLMNLILILLGEIESESYNEPVAPKYIDKVFPYLRDAHKVLILKIHNKIPEDFFSKRIERYKNYCEKKKIEQYFDLVWEVFENINKLRLMKDAYVERATFEKM